MRTQIFVLAMAVFEISSTLQKHWGLYERPAHEVVVVFAYIFVFSVLLDIIKK